MTRKIPAARNLSSFKMAFTITDRRVKGAPILRLRRTTEGFLCLAASAFRAGPVRCLALFLPLCSLGAATAAPPAHAPADPVREAAALAIKKLDLQVSMPHEAVPTDYTPNWHLPGWLIYVLAAIAVGVIAWHRAGHDPGLAGTCDDDGWATTGDGLPGGGDLAGDQPRPGPTRWRHGEILRRGTCTCCCCTAWPKSAAELRLEFADSLTSREILRRARLPEEVHRCAAQHRHPGRAQLFQAAIPATQPDYDSRRAGF